LTQAVQQESLYIGGRWITPSVDRSIQVVNPASGEAIAEIGYGAAADAVAAVDAAAEAFPGWSRLPARQRSDILLRAHALLVERAEEIGLLLARESGKRLPEGVGEVRFAAEYFRWFAEQARRPVGAIVPQESPNRRHLIVAQPAGVALCLTPWNFPVSIQARKLAPALAAGCTVVARASEKAPLAVIEMFRCLQEAGLPAGVANLIQGPAGETTSAMLKHPAVRIMSFTGSTGVGRSLMKQAAERIVRPLLELGGDAPFVVFDDAELDRAVEGAMLAKFRNNGQSCIAANRFLVQEGVYEEFCGLVAGRVDAMGLGDPVTEPIPDLGPVIDADRKQAVESMVAEAKAAGARLLTGPRELPERGTFTSPALLAEVPDQVALACEEVFGPAAGIFPFRTEDEAIERANRTAMGLAGYLYTTSLDRSWRVSEALEVGILGLNNPLPSVAFAPMGGVKQSGLGREGSNQGLEEFTELKYVALEI
jgi:succinate-semialdehyde dehydrogenase / glutarate-semialdehyde dehydrogenase